MTPSTEILGGIALALLVLALATVIYQFAKSPAELQPDVGQKGLKRKAILDEQGLFNTIEPLMRWLARRIASLPIEDTRTRINDQLRQAGEYLGLTADEYLALSVISSIGLLIMALGMVMMAAAGIAGRRALVEPGLLIIGGGFGIYTFGGLSLMEAPSKSVAPPSQCSPADWTGPTRAPTTTWHAASPPAGLSSLRCPPAPRPPATPSRPETGSSPPWRAAP